MPTHPPYNEPALLRQLTNGDATAYSTIYHQHLDAIFYFTRKYIHTEQDAEDITASVFQQLWHQRATLDADRPIRPYLYTIARNRCLNHLKLTQRRSEREAEAMRLLHTEDENSHELIAALMQEIDVAIQQLPPQMAHIFTLAYFEGKNNHEIASLLGINEHTVRNQKSLALKQLRLSFRSWMLFLQLF